MKNKRLVHHWESAKIYRMHYKPTFNLLRLLKSILAIFITGSSHASTVYNRKK